MLAPDSYAVTFSLSLLVQALERAVQKLVFAARAACPRLVLQQASACTVADRILRAYPRCIVSQGPFVAPLAKAMVPSTVKL